MDDDVIYLDGEEFDPDDYAAEVADVMGWTLEEAEDYMDSVDAVLDLMDIAEAGGL